MYKTYYIYDGVPPFEFQTINFYTFSLLNLSLSLCFLLYLGDASQLTDILRASFIQLAYLNNYDNPA